MKRLLLTTCLFFLAPMFALGQSSPVDLGRWQSTSKKLHAKQTGHQVEMSSDGWEYLLAPESRANVALSATVVIAEPATRFQFFGSSWSVWPDRTFGDQGFDAGLIMRTGDGSDQGYRVQISHKLQEVTLVRFPDGGYLRSVPCKIPLNTPLALQVIAAGRSIRVWVDGRERIDYVDYLQPPLKQASFGIGVSSLAKVKFRDVKVDTVKVDPRAETVGARPVHRPDFRVRRWIGARKWVFDGDEPILLLPDTKASYINNVKLRPGYKPLLSWNSHWDIQNQGAFKEGTNHTVDVQTEGGGTSLVASWRGEHDGDCFATKTRMTVGYDPKRQVYTYDIDSELDVFKNFHFRYGYDFEHHTPLDPFRWQYLIARRRDGSLYHRPVYPIDPGPQNDLAQKNGLRVWYGRHLENMPIAPAVEYHIPDAGKRQCNTAVCAAFYDTGVSFAPETAKAGTKVRVQYRYTGYLPDEAKKLFEQSTIYEAATLDPDHHYIFADEWPRLTFSKFVPLSETWIYGRRPFRTPGSVRPRYELVKNCGAGSGFAMRLGPASFGQATLPVPTPITPGKYAVRFLVKSENVHGPGGFIEITTTRAKSASKSANKPGEHPAAVRHYVGNGSADWHVQGFAFDVAKDTTALALALGNAGTGSMLVTDVSFTLLPADGKWPGGVVAAANGTPAPSAKTLDAAIADYRMAEGAGHYVYNAAGGDHLQLANVDWVRDGGHAALRFKDNPAGKQDFPRDSTLARNYFEHSGYHDRKTVALALAGHHGGGKILARGLTIAAWIKPAGEMGKSQHPGRGDIVGYGARRFILGLRGQKSPYQLTGWINVNDVVPSKTALDAGRWYHVAMTAQPQNEHWAVRLFVDGKQVGESTTTRFPVESVVSHSIVLGTEIFYFHSSYYRGLIGRTVVVERALAPNEIANLVK